MATGTEKEVAGFGRAFQNLPIRQLLYDLAAAVGQSQGLLDKHARDTLLQASESTIEIKVKRSDGSFETVEKSVLELGFIPPFYTFTEVTLDLSVALSMHSEQGFGIAGAIDVGYGTAKAKKP